MSDLGLSRFCTGMSKYCSNTEDSFFETNEPLSFDLAHCNFVSVSEATAIAMMYLKATSIGKKTSIKYSRQSDCFRYLQRINFFNILNISTNESFSRHPTEDRFLELTRVSEDNNMNDLPTALMRVIAKQSEITDSVANALNYAFGEIIDNITTHARSDINGLVSAQWYQRRNQIDLCVVDAGIGIPASLKNNNSLSDMSDSDLLLKSFEYGIGENTTLAVDSEGYGCGFGLTFVSNLAKKTNGSIGVISRNSSIFVNGNHKTVGSGLFFPGTFICVSIPTDVDVTSVDLYPGGKDVPFSWNPVDGFDDDDMLNTMSLW